MAAVDPKNATDQCKDRSLYGNCTDRKSDFKACKSSTRDCSTFRLEKVQPSSREYPVAVDQIKVEGEVQPFTRDKQQHNSLWIKTEIKDESSSSDESESFGIVKVIVGEDSFSYSVDGSTSDVAAKASAKYYEDSNHFMSTEEWRKPAMIDHQDSMNRVNVDEGLETPVPKSVARSSSSNGEAPFASDVHESLNVGVNESSAAESEYAEAKELNVDRRRCNTKHCEKNLPEYGPKQSSGLEMDLTPSEEDDVLCVKSLTKICRFIGDQQSKQDIDQKVPTGEKPYECLDCDKTYCVLSDLKRHQRIHTGEKPYACAVCKKAFRLSSTWSIHQRSHTGEKPYACLECKKTFTQLSTLHSHQRIHTGEKPYECRVCTRSFTDSSTLRQHERTHTGEKPYQCSECLQTFSQSSVLRRHEAIHTGEKPYECTVCKKSFSDSSSMIAHQRIHTGEKPYQCKWCEKTFRYTSTLRGHQRIHTGEKPYECGECKKTFSQFSSLMQHKRIHTGEKPYACTVCSKAFSVSYALTKHKRIHTGEKPFECKECSKTFRLSSDLTRHYRIHNRVLLK